jgi:hypothetical protein
MTISENNWNNFVDNNNVSDIIINLIAEKIKLNYNLTIKELAIYYEHANRIENKLKKDSK